MNCKVKMMCRKGSKACTEIVKHTNIKRYFGHNADILVNYGLSGQKLRDFYRKIPSAKRIPTVNKFVGRSKYKVVQIAKENKILVPESKLKLTGMDQLGQWIEKRFNSQSGYGIRWARGRAGIPGKYYQKFVSDRVSELRVHGFGWIKPSGWRIQRRFGEENEIAWNYKRGGRFVTVRNLSMCRSCRQAGQVTEIMLRLLGMGFGAADFVVDKNGSVWFIEINSCPGFQELSREIYTDAFEALRDMKLKDALKYAN